MKRLIMSLLICVMITGCTYFAPKKVKQEAALSLTESKILDQARYMNDTTVEALKTETNRTPRVVLATQTSTEVQRLIGQHPYERFDVDAWCRTNEQARADLSKRLDDDTAMLKLRISQAEVLDQVKDKLINYGQKYEEERNQRVWWKFWTWSTTTLIIAGFICLCIFTPVGPMVLSGMMGLLWKFLPKLMGFFKVSSIKPLDNVMKGNENFKSLMQTTPVSIEASPTQTFTYTDVQNMIKSDRADMLQMWKDELHKTTDNDDKALIDERKRQINIQS